MLILTDWGELCVVPGSVGVWFGGGDSGSGVDRDFWVWLLVGVFSGALGFCGGKSGDSNGEEFEEE